jgi:hypothetical protein
LIVRYRGMGFIAPAMQAITSEGPLAMRAIAYAVVRIPGLLLLARAIDFFIGDPLHHYMEVGMLRGVKDRAERAVGVKASPAGLGQQDVAIR